MSGKPPLDPELRPHSLPPGQEGRPLRPCFPASKSAYLKQDPERLLLVGQSNSPSGTVDFLASQASFALELPVGFQALFLDGPACGITNGVEVLTLPGLPRLDAGLAPKEFLAILRFERAAGGQGGLPEGHYDQSHYIKAHRRFAGGTPGRKAAGLSDSSYTPSTASFIVSSI